MWLFPEQLRLQFVQVFHRLFRCQHLYMRASDLFAFHLGIPRLLFGDS